MKALPTLTGPSGPLPVTTRFRLGATISPDQQAFLDYYGFLHFEGVASASEVAMITSEMDRVEAQWLAEERKTIHGIPVFWGRSPDGRKAVQRFAFTSVFSPAIGDFVRDPRFEPARTLVGMEARVGDREKDGVVINRYWNVPGSAYPRLGWHTDGLRDLFNLRMPDKMLNVGLHLDDCPADNGGLRLIPGSHNQGFMAMAFSKPYFVWHKPDPREIAVETRAGDLTVHDGRLWHRVEQSTREGDASLRRSMYVPYLTGPYEPKDDASPTPPYHKLGVLLRRLRTARAR